MNGNNNDKITEGLEEIIEVVDAPEEAKKTDKIPRIIKLASSTFRKATSWFKKQLNKIQITITQKRIEKYEDKLANKEFQRVNEEREKVEKSIYKKALKYEKLKDKLDLLIANGYNRIPKKVDIPAEKRAINLRNAMFQALRYNGSGWVIDPDKREDVFSVNNKIDESETIEKQEKQENVINFDDVDQELKTFKTDIKENHDTPVVENTSYINPEDIMAITQKPNILSRKEDIIQDLPINSVTEQKFNAVGMSDEEIAESMQKIGEYKDMINNNDEDKKAEENIPVSESSEEKETTEIRENGTKVVTSADGKSKMFDFTNADRTYVDGTTKVSISNNGKSRVYEFNATTSEKENDTVVNTEQKEEQNTQKLDLNELKNFRSQLAQLNEQRKAAEEAKQKAAEERMAAERAVQDARMKAQQAKESYIERINKEQAEIDAINSDISNMNSDIQKNQQAAKMANEYAQAIEQMISGDESISEEKGNTK